MKDDNGNHEIVQISTGANSATYLLNVGREGETNLHHIISN
jgi:uncharacterized membrane protein